MKQICLSELVRKCVKLDESQEKMIFFDTFFQEEPFTALMPEALFNISRFLLTRMEHIQLEGVSKLTIMFALIKQARLLGANKLAMQLLDRLRRMKIPNHHLTQVETWMIVTKTYPYWDPEELLPLCNRCSTYNALLPANDASSSSCAQCGCKFQYSFVMFGEKIFYP